MGGAMKKVLFSLIIVSIVVGFTLTVGCGNHEANQGGIETVEPLQLGELQVHTFDDKDFAVSYPADWVEVNTSSESGITLRCDNICLDKPLVLGIVRPLSNTSFTDAQAYIEFLISAHTQTVGSPPISKEAVTVDGKQVVKAAWEEGNGILEVDLYLTSDNGNMVSPIMSFCDPNCWEYYKGAVYAIIATYQFLD